MRKAYQFKDPRTTAKWSAHKFDALLELMQQAGTMRDYSMRRSIELELRWRLMQSWSAGVAEGDARASQESLELFGGIQ